MTQVIRISDLPHPDHEGKSYREVNLEKQHNIPVGKLVEIDMGLDEDDYAYDEKYAGMRLFVVGHHRDCDGTPLYSLGSKGMDMWQEDDRFHNPKTYHGFPEDCLSVIDKD